MSKAEKLALLKFRYNRLAGTPKNIKAPGVVRKLSREIRKGEN